MARCRVTAVDTHQLRPKRAVGKRGCDAAIATSTRRSAAVPPFGDHRAVERARLSPVGRLPNPVPLASDERNAE